MTESCLNSSRIHTMYLCMFLFTYSRRNREHTALSLNVEHRLTNTW